MSRASYHPKAPVGDEEVSAPFPILRLKRDPHAYRGPRPAPGQTVMICPVEARFRLFDFTPDDGLRCVACSYYITRSLVY